MHRFRLTLRVAATTGLWLALGLAKANAESAVTQAPVTQAPGVKVAIAEFGYVDTSGEPADQVAVHRKQLQAFMTALGADFESDHAFRLLPFSCPPLCADGGQKSDDLVDAAAKVGAKVLVTGGIHKLSTLVQWAKVTAFDVDAHRVVYDKLFTFRGDSDAAWQRAEVFVSREVRAALAGPPAHDAEHGGDRP